jgi:hypothetical protein
VSFASISGLLQCGGSIGAMLMRGADALVSVSAAALCAIR